MGKVRSCAECRRLKLKCIRERDAWPCQPCQRRRCEELCPESSSATTDKAASERLLRHYRTKIASLEAELKRERAAGGLLRSPEEDFEDGEGGDDLAPSEQDGEPSVVYASDGLVANQRHFHGRSSGAYFAHPTADVHPSPSYSSRAAVRRAEAALKQIPFEDATDLLLVYAQSVTWLYSPISCATIHRLLRKAYDANCSASEMSIVCFALALGNHFQRAIDGEAAEFHRHLHRLGIDCLMHYDTLQWPSLEAAAAAHLCTSYLLSQGESSMSQAAWQVLGLGIRLAVSLGLHCDQSQFGAIQERQEASSWVFWELLVYERLQSLNFGRPGLLPKFVSCPRPQTDSEFHTIKYDLCQLYSQINDLIAQPKLPEHAAAMELDAQVRAFEARIPAVLDLQHPLPEQGDPHLVPQRHMLSLLIHKALLFLHRPWFARSLLSAEEPLFSPLANSFAAAVKSARQHTLLYESALKSNPMICSWWFFVFHLFTAAVVQAQVLIRAPTSLLAAQCHDDFELSHSLLGKAARFSRIASRAVDLLKSVRAGILFDLAAQSSRPQSNAALLAATAIVELHSVSSAEAPEQSCTGDGAETGTWSGTESSVPTAQEATPQDSAAFSTDLSDILSASLFPPDILHQSEWMEMDPLLQAAVYWHPHCAS